MHARKKKRMIVPDAHNAPTGHKGKDGPCKGEALDLVLRTSMIVPDAFMPLCPQCPYALMKR